VGRGVKDRRGRNITHGGVLEGSRRVMRQRVLRGQNLEGL